MPQASCICCSEFARQKSSPVIKEVTYFKNLNYDKLRHNRSTAPWSVCEIFDDVDDVAWAWEYLYKDVMTDDLKTVSSSEFILIDILGIASSEG